MFGGVHGLEVAPGLGGRSVWKQFLRRDVVSGKAFDVLQVQADARIGHVRGVGLQEILAPVPGEGVGRGFAIGCDQHIEVGADSLVVVSRGCEAAEVVEEQKNPVDPGLKRVQSVLKAWKGLDLPEEFEMGACDTVAVFRDNFDADRPEQVGSEGHDVAARVERLRVRVQRDDGGVVHCERMDKGVLQARLVINLMLQAGSRPRGVINGRVAESVFQDQRPAGSAVVVLPQPGRQPVEIQEPPSLLVAREILVVKFGKRSL